MRLITVRIQPSLPRDLLATLAPTLKRAGVDTEHFYADTTDSFTRIGLYVRCEDSELNRTADAVVEALTPVAGEDRLVRAQFHPLAGAEPKEHPWW